MFSALAGLANRSRCFRGCLRSCRAYYDCSVLAPKSGVIMIMVDELQSYPQRANTEQGRRYFGEGKQSCHLTITPGESLDELHAFAAKIGMKREWFQADKTCPHYDLMPSRRTVALTAGATFVTARDQVIERRAFRVKMTGEPSAGSWNFLTGTPGATVPYRESEKP
jgi:hypothetical protein